MSAALNTFRQWARAADYGDEFVYHKSGLPRSVELFDHARKLHDAGLVFLYQRRRGVEFDHVARRTSVKAHVILDKVSEAVKAPRTRYSDEADGRVGRPSKFHVV